MLIVTDKKARRNGIKKYLVIGTNGDRNIKDNRVAIVGDLDVLQGVVDIGDKKGYKECYRNIVLSFAEDKISPERCREIAQSFIEQYMSGYKKDEYVAYAEVHYPKILITGRGEPRKPHIHIVLAKYSPKLGKQLDMGTHNVRIGRRGSDSDGKTEFAIWKQNIEEKYNLIPGERSAPIAKDITAFRDIKNRTEAVKMLNEYISANIDKINSFDALKTLLNQITKVETVSKNAKIPYITLQVGTQKVRLKGLLFSKDSFESAKKSMRTTENIALQRNLPSKNKTIAKNNEKIHGHHDKLRLLADKRIKVIDAKYKKARSTADEVLESILQKSKKKQLHNSSIEPSTPDYGQTCDDIYKKGFLSPTKNLWIKEFSSHGKTTIVAVNKQKGIKVVDTGDKLTAKGTNEMEQAKLMIAMAKAKGWDLSRIKINGSKTFIETTKKLIGQEKNGMPKQDTFLPHESKSKSVVATKMSAPTIDKERVKIIKKSVHPEALLFAIGKAPLDYKYWFDNKKDEWKITCGNRNLNVSDFLTKEVGMRYDEALKTLESCMATPSLQETIEKMNITAKDVKNVIPTPLPS